MKRIILIVALSLSIIPAFSQVSIGIIGGGTFTHFHYGNSDYMTNSFLTRWHAGVIAETKLWGHFYLQPQLLFSKQGGDSKYERETGTESFYTREKATTTYLQLPLNVVYKFGRWYAGAGPYIARGLNGKHEFRNFYGKSEPIPYFEETRRTGDVKFQDSPDGVQLNELWMRQMDYGANFIGGYALKNGLFFNANYNMGLTGIYGSGSKVRNRYWGVSVGYFLKK